jgi:hypothetical protein
LTALAVTVPVALCTSRTKMRVAADGALPWLVTFTATLKGTLQTGLEGLRAIPVSCTFAATGNAVDVGVTGSVCGVRIGTPRKSPEVRTTVGEIQPLTPFSSRM